MAVEFETRITAANFNTLQNRVERLLGGGSGQSGYGQVPNRSPVPPQSVVYASDLNKLLLDINRISIHQTGSITDLSPVTQSSKIRADEETVGDRDGWKQYIAKIAELETDPLVVDGTQVSIETIATDSRFSPWQGQLSHSFTLTFTDTDHRRAFFNSGGQIYISAQIESPSTPKSNDWKTMLTNMGVIQFKANTTSKTGLGGTLFPNDDGPVGNFQLTAGLVTLFERTGQLDSYSENRYYIFGKEVSQSAIQFTIQFQDQDQGDPTIDEEIAGTVVSRIQALRPSGEYVSVPLPSYSVQSSLELGD
jgi:hypothetical protein